MDNQIEETPAAHSNISQRIPASGAPECVKILDGEGNVTAFDESGLCAMEIDDFATVKGQFWPSLWPAEVRGLVEQGLKEARRNGSATFTGPCPTAKGKPKYWDVSINALPRSAGLDGFVVVSRDITKQRDDLQTERESHERLQRIMDASGDVLWDIDLLANRVWWSEGMRSVLGYGPDQIGPGTRWCHEHIHPEDRERVVESMAQAVQSTDVFWESEFRYLKADGTYLDVYDRGAVIRDEAGKAMRFVGVMQDVSARKALADRQDQLAKEMAHRVNNTLAVIMGLFQLTKQRSADLETFAEDFGRRLTAMAHANSVLLHGSGAGFELGELVRTQLAPFMQSGQLKVDGPHVNVAPEVGQPMALVLNELATNAVKHGALSSKKGIVTLNWEIGPRQQGTNLVMRWRERGGPPVKPPEKKGLGSRLISNGIPRALVETRFESEGLTCTVQMLPGDVV